MSKIPNRKKLENRYKNNFYTHETVLNKLHETLKYDLESIGLHPTIKSRVKSFDSYFNKILRLLFKKNDYRKAVDIYDILGVRIVCPFLANLQTAENYVKQTYDVIQVECKGSEHSFREFGYRSTHFLIHVPEKILGQCHAVEPLICEIQLRTILQDAWAEVEHELIYKTDFSPFDEPMKRKLAALNANLTLSDTLFQEIRDYQRKLQAELDKRRESFMHKVHPSTVPALSIKKDFPFPEPNLKEDQASKDDGLKNKSVDDLLVDALIAHNTGEYEKAIVIYSSILKREFPENIKSIIHVHRGMAHFAQSHFKQALEDFSISLNLSPDNYRAFYYRGLAHEAEKDYQSALEDFNACIEINPYQFEPLYSRAELYILMEDYTKAMADCRQLLKIEPGSSKAKQLKNTLGGYKLSKK